MMPQSTLAKSPHLEESRIQSYLDYSPDWVTLLQTVCAASVVATTKGLKIPGQHGDGGGRRGPWVRGAIPSIHWATSLRPDSFPTVFFCKKHIQYDIQCKMKNRLFPKSLREEIMSYL